MLAPWKDSHSHKGDAPMDFSPTINEPNPIQDETEKMSDTQPSQGGVRNSVATNTPRKFTVETPGLS